jgi:two-component system sensor histidine kinase PhoQ
MQTQLMGQIYALLGAADTDALGRMRPPETLPDPRFANPASGLYAQVRGEQGQYQWHSPSAVGRQFPMRTDIPPGSPLFQLLPADESLYLLSYSLLWEDDSGAEIAYLLVVAESAVGVQQRVAAFRQTILLWLGGAALILLLVQGAVLRWGLKPLRSVAADLRMIETGARERLEGEYPRELRRLTDGINSMIRHSVASRDRYRNRLGDLAHSLKTPLAVLQGAAEGEDPRLLREAVAEQVPRMNEIVQYQLKSAAAAGRGAGLGQKTALRPILDRLVRTLQKVYREKSIHCRCEVAADLLFPGESGDLLECLGNILENAFKYTHTTVAIYVDADRTDAQAAGVRLCVADDGPGIPPEVRERVLRRGERVDQRIPGQGIGLSVAGEIVHLYGGELEIGESTLGGALIGIRMPE